MSDLRSFASYGNTAPVQPNIWIDAFGAGQGATAATRPINFPCSLVNLDGYANGACWFQVFDQASSPTNGTVPLKSINVAAAGNLSSLLSSIGGININQGLWFACSSTEGTLTTNGAITFDAWGEIEEFEGQQITNATILGDLTTGVDKVATTNAGRTILAIDVINGLGAVAYLMIFALPTASVVNGVTPIVQIPLANVSTVQRFRFGTDGLVPYSRDSNFTERRLLAVAVSTTAGTLTLAGTNLNNIRVLYATKQ